MGRLLRPSPASLAYVAVVGVLAASGFAGESPMLILAAAALALPAAVIAVPGYYLAYGVLATVAGATPSLSTGGGGMSPGGRVVTAVSSGDPAVWFTVAADGLGVVALVLAAVGNVLLLRLLAVRRTASPGAAADPES